MSVEIEEMLHRYAQQLDRLAPDMTAAEVRARAEQLAAGDGAAGAATGPDGSRPVRGYFIDQHEHHTVAVPGRHTQRRRVIGVLAAAAAVIVAAVAVAVTRPSTHHQTKPVPTAPVVPATTAAPPTTAAPTTVAPPPAGTGPGGGDLTITPNTRLTDQRVVHVVGTGLYPGMTYTVSECKAYQRFGVYRGNCFIASSHSVIADATGTVSTDLKVQKVFPGPGGLGDPPGPVDCGAPPSSTWEGPLGSSEGPPAITTGCIVVLSREEADGSTALLFVGLGQDDFNGRMSVGPL